MVDSTAGAINIQNEPGASVVPERIRKCSKKKTPKNKKKWTHNDGDMSPRDTGAYWKSSQRPKLEQFEQPNNGVLDYNLKYEINIHNSTLT